MANNGMSFKVRLGLAAQGLKNGINDVKNQLTQFKNFVVSAFAVTSVTSFIKTVGSVGGAFQTAMGKIKAVTNANTEDLEKLRKKAMEIGSTTQYSASQAAGALENLGRAGLSAQQSIDSVDATMTMAGANAIELAQSADIMTNTMGQFGLSAKESSRIADVFSAACANSA